jgi:hypothetical protein
MLGYTLGMFIMRNIDNKLVKSSVVASNFRFLTKKKETSDLVGLVDISIDDITIRDFTVFEHHSSHTQWIQQPNSCYLNSEGKMTYKQLTSISEPLLKAIKEEALTLYNTYKQKQLGNTDWLTKEKLKYA